MDRKVVWKLLTEKICQIMRHFENFLHFVPYICLIYYIIFKLIKFKKFQIPKQMCIPLLGVAPMDLDHRFVLLNIRFVCANPPPCTFWGCSDTPKYVFRWRGNFAPPPSVLVIFEANLY